MKRQKDVTLKDELLRSVGAQYANGKEHRSSSIRNEDAGQSRNNTQLWRCLDVKVKKDVLNNKIT